MSKLKHECCCGLTDPAQFISNVLLDTDGENPVRIVTSSQQRLFNANSCAFHNVDTSYQRMELQCDLFGDARFLLGDPSICLSQSTSPWRVDTRQTLSSLGGYIVSSARPAVSVAC